MTSRTLKLPVVVMLIAALAWAFAVSGWGAHWGSHIVILGSAVMAVGSIIVAGWSLTESLVQAHRRTQDALVVAVAGAEDRDRIAAQQRQEILDELEAARTYRVVAGVQMGNRLDALATSAQLNAALDNTQGNILAAMVDAVADAEAARTIGDQQRSHLAVVRSGHHN